MKPIRLTVVLLWALVVAACSQYGSTGVSPSSTTGGGLAAVSGQGPGRSPRSAVVQFGQANVGSPFPPGSEHDQSAHAVDNLVPRTVVIDVGGTVTFNLPASVHQIKIYKPGTEPGDIDTSTLAPLPAPCPPLPFLITDSDNLEAAIDVPCFTPTQRSYTFDRPGRYLVICAFVFHFQVGMYGWVEVRDRQS